MRKLQGYPWLILTIMLGLIFSQIPTPPVRAEALNITAKAAVLMDPLTGTVLWEKNSHQQLEPASITKIMTQVLILEALQQGRISLSDTVVASETAYRMGGSQIDLFPGEVMTVKELLMAISIHSANDACIALAEHIAGTHEAFIEQMNARARDLGMKDTVFKNSHGLSAPGHVTSAYDVALLSSYAVRKTNITDYSSVWEYWLRDGQRWLVNRNRLIKFYPGMDGLKTGFTAGAQNCLSATALRGGLRLVAVVMGAPTSDIRFAEGRNLLDYGFANYQARPVIKRGDSVKTVDVVKGNVDRLSLQAAEDFDLTVKKGEETILSQEVRLSGNVVAPVQQGQKLGEVVIYCNGQEVGRVALLAAEDVQKGSVFRSIYRLFRLMVNPVKGIFSLP